MLILQSPTPEVKQFRFIEMMALFTQVLELIGVCTSVPCYRLVPWADPNMSRLIQQDVQEMEYNMVTGLSNLDNGDLGKWIATTFQSLTMESTRLHRSIEKMALFILVLEAIGGSGAVHWVVTKAFPSVMDSFSLAAGAWDKWTMAMLPYRTKMGKLHKSSGTTGPCILAHDQIGGCGKEALDQWRM